MGRGVGNHLSSPSPSKSRGNNYIEHLLLAEKWGDISPIPTRIYAPACMSGRM